MLGRLGEADHHRLPSEKSTTQKNSDLTGTCNSDRGTVEISGKVDGKSVTLGYTKTAGGSIAAAEFMNEPNYAAQGGAPKGYDAAAFGRDIDAFRRFFREAAPGSLFLGPGSTGEGGVLGKTPAPGKLKTEDLLKATGPVFDVLSYHIYAAVSQRCASALAAFRSPSHSRNGSA